MAKFEIKENFKWMASPEFKIVDSGKNTVTIKGVAVRKNQVSRNRRRYVEEELVKGARTFIGKPVTINHAPYDRTHPMYDGRKVPGNVRWMEYENGAMEYMVDIKKQPYVDLLRNKSVEVKGVSIEADYLRNRCSHCGKDFFDQAGFEDHMVNEHFIRNFNYEPRGIVGRALSLVLSPEEPGVSGTTIELCESAGGFERLLETVINIEQEKKSLNEKLGSKASIQPITRITVDKAKRVAEQDEHGEGQVKQDEQAQDEQSKQNSPIHPVIPLTPDDPEEDKAAEGEKGTSDKAATPNPTPPETKVTEQEGEKDEHGCVVGKEKWDGKKCVAVASETEPERDEHGCVVGKERWDGDKCVPSATEALDCPEGFHPNEDGTECVADTPEPEESTEETIEENPDSQEPVLHPVTHVVKPQEHEKSETIPEEHTVVLPSPPETKVVEIKLPIKLRLGEPFSGYDSHEDCVNKNQDKEDPAAYCASIKQKVEGETLRETLGFNSSYARDMRISSATNLLCEAVASLHNVSAENRKSLREYIQKNAEQNSGVMHENFGVLETYTKVAHAKISVLSEAMDNAARTISKLLEQNKRLIRQLGTLATEAAKQKQHLGTFVSKEQLVPYQNRLGNVINKDDFNTLQNQVDELKKMKETIGELNSKLNENDKKIEDSIKDLSSKVDEHKTNQVKETADKLVEIKTSIDNLEHMIKPEFKAKSQRIIETEEGENDKPFVKDPNRGGK